MWIALAAVDRKPQRQANPESLTCVTAARGWCWRRAWPSTGAEVVASGPCPAALMATCTAGATPALAQGREQARQGAAVLMGTATGKGANQQETLLVGDGRPRSQSCLFRGVSEASPREPKDTHTTSQRHQGQAQEPQRAQHTQWATVLSATAAVRQDATLPLQVTCFGVWPVPRIKHWHPGADPASRTRPAELQLGPGSGGTPCAVAPAR